MGGLYKQVRDWTYFKVLQIVNVVCIMFGLAPAISPLQIGEQVIE